MKNYDEMNYAEKMEHLSDMHQRNHLPARPESIPFDFLKTKDSEYRGLADKTQSEYREYHQMAWACRFVVEIWNDESNEQALSGTPESDDSTRVFPIEHTLRTMLADAKIYSDAHDSATLSGDHSSAVHNLEKEQMLKSYAERIDKWIKSNEQDQRQERSLITGAKNPVTRSRLNPLVRFLIRLLEEDCGFKNGELFKIMEER